MKRKQKYGFLMRGLMVLFLLTAMAIFVCGRVNASPRLQAVSERRQAGFEILSEEEQEELTQQDSAEEDNSAVIFTAEDDAAAAPAEAPVTEKTPRRYTLTTIETEEVPLAGIELEETDCILEILLVCTAAVLYFFFEWKLRKRRKKIRALENELQTELKNRGLPDEMP